MIEDDINKEIEKLEKLKRDIKSIPTEIPIEPQDIQFQQPSLPSAPSLPSPKLSYPTMPVPETMPEESVTKAQAAYEVSRVLNNERIMSIIGIIASFVPLMLGIFNQIFGYVGVIGFASYFVFIFWRTDVKRKYMRYNYGV